jgi:hypothetical protein
MSKSNAYVTNDMRDLGTKTIYIFIIAYNFEGAFEKKWGQIKESVVLWEVKCCRPKVCEGIFGFYNMRHQTCPAIL